MRIGTREREMTDWRSLWGGGMRENRPHTGCEVAPSGKGMTGAQQRVQSDQGGIENVVKSTVSKTRLDEAAGK